VTFWVLLGSLWIFSTSIARCCQINIEQKTFKNNDVARHVDPFHFYFISDCKNKQTTDVWMDGFID